MAATYPIFLDLTGRRAVIIGGGAVAGRKAGALLEAGAAVKVVAVVITAMFADAVEKVEKRYDKSDLDGATLAFAATDLSEVNDAVVADARAAGIWVNRADPGGESPGDFVTPARFSNGPITVAVTAGSAALSTLVRDGLRQRFDPNWTTMAQEMETLRPFIRDRSSLPPELRRQIFRDLATDDAVRVLADGQLAGLLTWLHARHPTAGLK